MAPRRRLGRKDDRGSWSASLPACLRGLLDRFTNAHIGAAATDIAGHRRVDVGIGGRRVAREQRRRGHDLAGLAVAALHDLAIEPGLLDPGARRGRADRFDRRDRGAADAIDRSDAGADGDAVKMHGAGAAQCHAAAELRSGHTEDIAQHPQQGSVAINIDRSIDAVDLDGGGHGFLQAVRVDRACEGSGCWFPLKTAQRALPRRRDPAEDGTVRGLNRRTASVLRKNTKFAQRRGGQVYSISPCIKKTVLRSCFEWYRLAPILRPNNDRTAGTPAHALHRDPKQSRADNVLDADPWRAFATSVREWIRRSRFCRLMKWRARPMPLQRGARTR